MVACSVFVEFCWFVQYMKNKDINVKASRDHCLVLYTSKGRAPFDVDKTNIIARQITKHNTWGLYEPPQATKEHPTPYTVFWPVGNLVQIYPHSLHLWVLTFIALQHYRGSETFRQCNS